MAGGDAVLIDPEELTIPELTFLLAKRLIELGAKTTQDGSGRDGNENGPDTLPRTSGPILSDFRRLHG